MSESTEVLVLRGTLQGHNGWVTSLSTCPANPDLLLSASRDKTLIVWQLTRDENQYGVAKKALRGHSHIVQDCQLTPDGSYALSGSWDKTLRLWKVSDGECVTRFDGHQGDVLSVSISRTVRQFVSASRDRSVKVWNALGNCIATFKSHQDWVSSVECSPSKDTIVYSAGWDKTVKVCINSYFFLFIFNSLFSTLFFPFPFSSSFPLLYFHMMLKIIFATSDTLRVNETLNYHQDL